MDESEVRTPARGAAAGRSESASPTSAAPGFFTPRTIVPSAPHSSASRSRLTPRRPRTTVPSAPHFSASRMRPRLPPVVDYSRHDVKMMKDLRLVREEEWFPHQRDEERLTGSWFWTVVQKDLYLPHKKKVSDMRSIDWASVGTSTGTDVRRYFAATLGLDSLLERQDLRWADPYIRQFYATLWIHPERSKIRFMFGKQPRELSRDDFAKYLGLSDSGARVHSLVNSNGNRDNKDHPPPLESIRHLYNNPDTLMEVSKDPKQLNRETAVVLTIVRLSIRPRPRCLDKLTTLEIWILHLLMSEKPIDVVDLMIGEMQAIIVDIRRLLPYAPYLIHLFQKKGWLEVGMKNDLDQHLMQYKPPKPGNKRGVKNKTLQTVKSNKAPKPDCTSVGTCSLPPQVEAPPVLDDDEDAHLDRTLSPSLEEQALVVTTNEEDDPDDNPYMVLSPVPGKFRFSQQGAHDTEAGGSGCHADVLPMLQSQADRQTIILEQIQGQPTELQRRQHERDLQKIQGQAHDTEAGGSGCHAEVPPVLQSQADRQTAILEQIQGQLAELQRQHERDLQKIQGQLAEHRQENRDLRNLVLLSFFQTARHSTQHSDIVALLNENLGAICRL